MDDHDEIYQDLEDSCHLITNSKSKSCDAISNKKEIKLLSKKANYSSLSETALKENEIDLLSDLIEIEEKEKAAKENHDAEFENLKKEIEKFKEVENLNNSKISELLTENINLKRNICSLYKTAKSEIEYKDSLLAEANKKLDSFLFHKNVHNFQPENFERNSSYSYNKAHSDRSESSYQSDGRRGYKRKRFNDSITSVNSEIELESLGRSSNLNKKQQLCSKQSNRNDSKLKQYKNAPVSNQNASEFKSETRNSNQDKQTTHQKDAYELSDKNIAEQKCAKESACTVQQCEPAEKCSKLVQTEETKPHKLKSKLPTFKAASTQTVSNPDPQSAVTNSDTQSRDQTETSNVFFSLLPAHLKQAFIEYEQNQIVSLNRLKQSFVNQHFNCYSSVHSPTRPSNNSQLIASFNHILFNKEDQDVPSVNTTSLLTPSTSHKNETDNHRLKCGDTPTSRASSSVDTRIDSCPMKTSMEKELDSVINCQKKRTPFVENKKSGRDDKSKNIIPKRIL